MPVIRHTEARRTTTPNAEMTTFASPTQGQAGLAVWGVQMEPGASGPPHRFDAEQVWTVLTGVARIELDGEDHEVVPGDTVVMPAGAPRRIHAGDAGPRAAATRRDHGQMVASRSSQATICP